MYGRPTIERDGVTRDCGEAIHIIQTPLHIYLEHASDVKYTARIEAQRRQMMLHVRLMLPRVPCNTVAFDAATAELLRNFS